jgi:stage V sporulation protein R
MSEHKGLGEQSFFSEVERKYPEFEAIFKKNLEKKSRQKQDLIQYLMENSDFLNKEKNSWMKTVMQIVRNTSLFFQPQIRTKIMNEGWASYWHETLFLQDKRIKGHEVDFARVNAKVTSLSRVGMNPYALGMRLFYYIEEMADKGKFAYEFQRLMDSNQRDQYNADTGQGRKFIFKIRENFSDFIFIHTFLDQDFVSRYNLFVAGKRLSKDRMVWEYYVKSRKAKDFREMIEDALYHPPHIDIDHDKSIDNSLYLVHHFEGKPLVKGFISNTMMGIEYLWGGPVQLETSEVVSVSPAQPQNASGASSTLKPEALEKQEIKWQRVVYTMKNRELSKQTI